LWRALPVVSPFHNLAMLALVRDLGREEK